MEIFVLLGAFGAALAAFWSQVSTILFQVQSIAIISFEVKYDGCEAVLVYLQHKAKRLTIGPKVYHGRWMYMRSNTRLQMILWDVYNSIATLYFVGRKPIWTHQIKTKNTGYYDDRESAHPTVMNVSFLRGTWPSNNAFMREVAEFYNDYIDQEKKNNHARHFISKIVGRSKKQIDLGHGGGSEIASRPTSSNDIYDLHHYRTATPINASRADIGSSASYLKVDNLALDVHALKAVHDARIWYKSETWYREHNIAWKLGWLLHGKPGCGKSMLVRAIAEELDLPVFSYDLTSLANDELIPAWQEMMSHVPCIALVEDIDTVWEGRRNVAGDLTFDCFLNCLDGIQRSDGLFVIITTNYIEKIDPALGVYGLNGKSSRPGRIDRVVEMLPPDTDGRYKIARRILDFNDNFDIDAIVKDGEGETGAQFQDRCITEAIKYL